MRLTLRRICSRACRRSDVWKVGDFEKTEINSKISLAIKDPFQYAFNKLSFENDYRFTRVDRTRDPIRSNRVIIGTAPQRPVVLSVGFLDRQVIVAREWQAESVPAHRTPQDGCFRAAKGSNFSGWVPLQYVGGDLFFVVFHADFAF